MLLAVAAKPRDQEICSLVNLLMRYDRVPWAMMIPSLVRLIGARRVLVTGDLHGGVAMKPTYDFSQPTAPTKYARAYNPKRNARVSKLAGHTISHTSVHPFAPLLYWHADTAVTRFADDTNSRWLTKSMFLDYNTVAGTCQARGCSPETEAVAQAIRSLV